MRKLLTDFKRIDNWLNGHAKVFIEKNKSILIIFAFGVYTKLWVLLLGRDFWHDEAFQYLYSQKPLSFIIAGNDVHPPLYNIFTHYLVQIFGNDILMLRWAGAAAFSVVFLLMTYYCIRDIFGERTAFWSAMLLAATPTYLLYSVEFRNYSWTLFFVIWQIWAFNKLIGVNNTERCVNLPQTITPVMPYILLSTVVIYSHYLASLIIFAQILYILYLRWRKEIDNHIVLLSAKLYGIIAVLCIPLLTYSLLMVSKMGSMWYHGIGWISLISAFSYIITPPLKIIIGAAIFIYIIAIYGIIRWRKDLNSNHVQFALYLIVPILTMWVLSVTKIFVLFHPRYFLFGGIGIFVLAARSLVKMTERDDQIDACLFGFYCLLVLITFNQGVNNNQFIDAVHTDIVDSVLLFENYTKDLPNCVADCTLIHSSQSTQTPYRVYFPNTKQYLITKLTPREEFTRGGSVISWDFVRKNISDVPRTRYMFYISDIQLPYAETIYRGDGLYVQKLN